MLIHVNAATKFHLFLICTIILSLLIVIVVVFDKNITSFSTIRRLAAIKKIHEPCEITGRQIDLTTIQFTEEDKKAIAITINSSGRTKHRLCVLISSLQSQSQQLNATIDITVFSDEEIEDHYLCGKAKVFIWEKESPHERYVMYITMH